jgi:ATP-dependent DNA helicase DinG
LGEPCFAEAARRRASTADVVVVNTHLYGMHLAAGGTILPEHDVVVLDECHQLEDVISSTAGLSLGAGRFNALSRVVGSVLADDALVDGVATAGLRVSAALAPHVGLRLSRPLPDEVAASLVTARVRIDDVLTALRGIETPISDANQRKVRAQKQATTLAEDIAAALALPDGFVAWVEGGERAASLEVAPIDVGPFLSAGIWSQRAAVLTSATVPLALPERIGLPGEGVEVLDVGSPFDYDAHALLYCATHLPDPRQAAFGPATHEELALLIEAAGGRTLALFTSWRAVQAAAAALKPRLPFKILVQGELPTPALVKAFAADESSCLFATTGLFQGVDVPGATLSLVTIDKLPFPRPDDPLLEARRERAGASAFRLVDLPRAATLLAQAAGRLIRRTDDRGVVAVLDRRLATAGYRWDLVHALPPMRRTRHHDEAVAFLESLPH